MELNEFLVEAKRNTYASGKEGMDVVLEDGSKDFIYENGIYSYRDRYYGFNPFIGQELVWENDDLIWGMNYIGRITSNEADPKEVYDFLKEALMEVPINLPLRGPGSYSRKIDHFRYNSNLKDNANGLDFFNGEEWIHLRGSHVYELNFHGGLVTQNARN